MTRYRLKSKYNVRLLQVTVRSTSNYDEPRYIFEFLLDLEIRSIVEDGFALFRKFV